MTNEQILKKAIEKAVKNGFKMPKDIIEWIIEDDMYHNYLIFSHDFAKTFWGEEEFCVVECDAKRKSYKRALHCEDSCKEENGDKFIWQYHLQQMVLLLDDERIKYLKKFI